jgi:hypothetical protein
MARGEIVFFIFVDGLRMHIPEKSETLQPWLGGCAPATTALFQKPQDADCRPNRERRLRWSSFLNNF